MMEGFPPASPLAWGKLRLYTSPREAGAAPASRNATDATAAMLSELLDTMLSPLLCHEANGDRCPLPPSPQRELLLHQLTFEANTSFSDHAACAAAAHRGWGRGESCMAGGRCCVCAEAISVPPALAGGDDALRGEAACEAGAPASRCYAASAVRKASLHRAGGGRVWRLASVESVVTRSCHTRVFGHAVQATAPPGCLERCGAQRSNTSSPCWADCFFQAALGAHSRASSAAAGGLSLAQLVAAWEAPFLPVEQGGCAAPAAADLPSSLVFHDGLAGVANYRIPALVLAPLAGGGAALVAFAEARHGGDATAARIAVRSSRDGGRSWSAVVFAAGAEDTPAARAACARRRLACRAANPAAVYDGVRGRVALVYVLRGFGEGEDALGNAMVTSADGGATWSAARDLSAAWGRAAGALPGPGAALQLGRGEHAGRILVPSHGGAYTEDFVSLSDDGGASWRTINQSFGAMDEAALTQLPNGSVLLNMRHLRSPLLGRALAVSHDGGESFGPLRFDAALTSPVCQASIVSFGGVTYFSNPASNVSRTHLSIRRSTDSAATWSSTLLVQAGASPGYSCLAKGELPAAPADSKEGRAAPAAREGGILYESASGISFSRFPLDF
ncbi:hypothetical protein AB1Y20_001956 [Prymnesium parvum]|uniref:Sialidase domain-containing protein n=1 Tax=Prymnesium parvum TaxID=97485 RepID=A0AB34JA51_PRYPA